MPFFSTISGAWLVSRFCRPDLLVRHIQGALPAGATSSCAKPVAVLASSCSLAVSVVAVHQTGYGGRGRIALDLQHLVIGGILRLCVSVPPCRLRYTWQKSAIRVGVRAWVVAVAIRRLGLHPAR